MINSHSPYGLIVGRSRRTPSGVSPLLAPDSVRCASYPVSDRWGLRLILNSTSGNGVPKTSIVRRSESPDSQMMHRTESGASKSNGELLIPYPNQGKRLILS